MNETATKLAAKAPAEEEPAQNKKSPETSKQPVSGAASPTTDKSASTSTQMPYSTYQKYLKDNGFDVHADQEELQQRY